MNTLKALLFALVLFQSGLMAECIEGDCIMGYGVAVYLGGDKYSGDWKDKKAEGKGTLAYANGNTYTGEWKNGMANGQGVMKYANGTKYEGEWQDSSAHGKGTLYDKDGKVMISGIWKKGKIVTGSTQEEK